MNEQQTAPPHIEVLSHNKVNRSTIIVAVVPVTIFSLLLAYALWRFLFYIALMALLLAAIGTLYLIALAVIDVRRRWLHAKVIHLGEHGALDAAAWRTIPLALPEPSTQVTEIQGEEMTTDQISQALDILELSAKGSGYRSIAKAYKEAGSDYWTEWRIRQLIESRKSREEGARNA
jgi:asparagine N-glycosylation enzyme membrane subunit Stt3